MYFTAPGYKNEGKTRRNQGFSLVDSAVLALSSSSCSVAGAQVKGEWLKEAYRKEIFEEKSAYAQTASRFRLLRGAPPLKVRAQLGPLNVGIPNFNGLKSGGTSLDSRLTR